MDCPSCGQAGIADGAPVCWRCGKALPAPPRRKADASPPASPAPRVVKNDAIVGISGTAVRLPEGCACCLGPAEATIPLACTVTVGNQQSDHTWSLPCCASCVRHIRWDDYSEGIAIGGTLLTVWIGAGIGRSAGGEFFAGALVLAIGISVYAALLRFARPLLVKQGPRCAAAAPAAMVESSEGTSFRFGFRNVEYGRRFAAANGAACAGEPWAPPMTESTKRWAVGALAGLCLLLAGGGILLMLSDPPEAGERINILVLFAMSVIGWAATMYIVGTLLLVFGILAFRDAWEKFTTG